MFSLSMSVAEFRFYITIANQPSVSEVIWKFPNELIVMFSNRSYKAFRINGFVSHTMIMPKLTITTLSKSMRHLQYRHSREVGSLEHQMLMRDIAISDTYIEFDMDRRFRFEVDVDTQLVPQQSEQNERISKMFDPVYSPKSPFLKIPRKAWTQVQGSVRNRESSYSFAKPVNQLSCFVVHQQKLYVLFRERTKINPPLQLETAFIAAFAPKEQFFPVNNEDLDLMYRAAKKKLVDEFIVIPFTDFYIVEGHKDGLRFKWHSKHVEKASKLTSVIRMMEES